MPTTSVAHATGTKSPQMDVGDRADRVGRAPQRVTSPRVYGWAMVATSSPRHALLIRRSIINPDDIAYFYAFVPADEPVLLSTLIRIAGIRWTVEEDFQQSKGQAGLDQTQARRCRSWRRHIILAITALVAVRRRSPGRSPRVVGEGIVTASAGGSAVLLGSGSVLVGVRAWP